MRYTEINEAAQLIIDALKAEIAGKDDNWVDFQVYKNYKGDIELSWALTFRRDTRVGAFLRYGSQVRSANYELERIANKYKANLIQLKLCTRESCQRGDDFAEGNGDRAYSEYEQTISGGATFKDVPQQAAAPAKAAEPAATKPATTAVKAKADAVKDKAHAVKTKATTAKVAVAGDDARKVAKATAIKAVNAALKGTGVSIKSGSTTTNRILVYVDHTYKSSLMPAGLAMWLGAYGHPQAKIDAVKAAIKPIE